MIRALVTEQSDLTLAELCERVSKATGKRAVTTATMCVELQRLQLPLKKSRFTLVKEKAHGFSKGGSSMTAK